MKIAVRGQFPLLVSAVLLMMTGCSQSADTDRQATPANEATPAKQAESSTQTESSGTGTVGASASGESSVEDLGWSIDDLKTFVARAQEKGAQFSISKVELKKEGKYDAYLVSFSDGSSMMGTISKATNNVDAANLGGEGQTFFSIMAILIALSNPGDVPTYLDILTGFVGEQGNHEIKCGAREVNGKNYTLAPFSTGYLFRVGDSNADAAANE